MSFSRNMFWSTLVKCKQLDDNRIRATIPDTTSLWNPRFPAHEQGDPAPYLFTKVKGDFQVWLKVSGKFKYANDQAGILIRQNTKIYMRVGIEVAPKTTEMLAESPSARGEYENCIATAIVNHQDRDNTTSPIRVLTDKLDGSSMGSTAAYWFSVKRRGNVLVAYCSDDGKNYRPIRMAHLSKEEKLFVGMYGACPVGKGLKVVFTDFQVKEGRPDTEEFDRPEVEELQESIHYPENEQSVITSTSLLDDGSDYWESDFGESEQLLEVYDSEDENDQYYTTTRKDSS